MASDGANGQAVESDIISPLKENRDKAIAWMRHFNACFDGMASALLHKRQRAMIRVIKGKRVVVPCQVLARGRVALIRCRTLVIRFGDLSRVWAIRPS